MKTKIENILKENLPTSAYKSVTERKDCFGGLYLRIEFAANDYAINRVKGQFPQKVSLNLDLADLELMPQVFGGMGGQSIYREIDPTNPKEKFYACKGVRIPFRKPKKEEKFILNAITKFAQNWVKALKENKDVLTHQKLVDYNELLK